MTAPATTAKMARLPMSYHNPRGDSVEVRLARRHGRRPETWHRYMYGADSVYQLAAKINRELVAGGEPARALALMLPIDESLASPVALELHDALHRAELADVAEQIADETFREKLRRGEATAEDARDYIRKSCASRRAAEEAEQAARRWIEEQEGKH